MFLLMKKFYFRGNHYIYITTYFLKDNGENDESAPSPRQQYPRRYYSMPPPWLRRRVRKPRQVRFMGTSQAHDMLNV